MHQHSQVIYLSAQQTVQWSALPCWLLLIKSEHSLSSWSGSRKLPRLVGLSCLSGSPIVNLVASEGLDAEFLLLAYGRQRMILATLTQMNIWLNNKKHCLVRVESGWSSYNQQKHCLLRVESGWSSYSQQKHCLLRVEGGWSSYSRQNTVYWG